MQFDKVQNNNQMHKMIDYNIMVTKWNSSIYLYSKEFEIMFKLKNNHEIYFLALDIFAFVN